MADPQDVKFRFGVEGQDSVAAAVRQLGVEMKNLKKQQEDTAKSSLSLKGAFDALVGSAVVYKIAQIGKEAFASAVSIGKMREETGVSAQTLSVLGQAADYLGVSAESIGKGIVKLNRNIYDLQTGSSKAATSFGAIGLKAKDFAGLNTDQKLRKVIDALGGMKDEGAKTAIATQILGKSGAELIPVFNRLAGEGFANVEAACKRFGLLLTDETVASAMAAAASLDDIEDAAKGVATQVLSGFAPALADAADALTDATVGQGVNGFQKVGEVAGNVLKLIVLGFQVIGKTIGAVAALLVEQFGASFDIIKGGASTVFSAFGQAAKGDFSGAWETLKAGYRDADREAQRSANAQKAIWKQLGGDIKEDFLNLFDPDRIAARQAERVNKLKNKDSGKGSVPIVDDAAAKAQLAFLRQQYEAELALFKANNNLKEQDDKNLYARGEISFAQYYARRRAILEAETAKELETLEKEKRLAQAEPAKSAAEEIARRQKVADIENKIDQTKVQAQTKEKALDQEIWTARLEADKKVLDFQNQILEAQGRTYEAAIAKINQEGEEIRRELAKSGLTPAQVDELVGKLQKLKAEDAQFNEQKKQGSLAMGALDLDRQQLENDIASGKVLQIDAERKLAEIEARRVEQLRQIAQLQLEAAYRSGDQGKIQEALQFKQQVEGIAISSNYAAQQWTNFKNQSAGAVQGDLLNFFTQGIESAHGFGDAMRGLASSVVDSLKQIAAQMLINLLIQKAMGFLGGLFGGGGGGGVGFGGSSEGAMGFGGGGFGLADGGLVQGAGTSTSDSIPARLSDGEFVVRAAAVRAVGVDTLAAINRGLRVPAISGSRLPRFAEGGLVQADRGGAMDLNLKLGLERGLILEHLSSSEAGKVIVQQLGNNSKGASKAIGRG